MQRFGSDDCLQSRGNDSPREEHALQSRGLEIGFAGRVTRRGLRPGRVTRRGLWPA
jgi:hypothetical protein